jgi:hemerythrin-like domain-containing protein
MECGSSHGEFLNKSALDKLSSLVGALSRRLTPHEAFEEKFFWEFSNKVGEGSVAIGSIHSDHASIRRIFDIIRNLRRFDNEDTAYSIRFAASNLLQTLEHHLEYEEKTAFPTLKALMLETEVKAKRRRDHRGMAVHPSKG